MQLSLLLGTDTPSMAPVMGSVPPWAMSSGLIVCSSVRCKANDRRLPVPFWPLLSDCCDRAAGVWGCGEVKTPLFSQQAACRAHTSGALPSGISSWSRLLLERGHFRYCQSESNRIGPAALRCWGWRQELLICRPCPWSLPPALRFLGERRSFYDSLFRTNTKDPMLQIVQLFIFRVMAKLPNHSNPIKSSLKE